VYLHQSTTHGKLRKARKARIPASMTQTQTHNIQKLGAGYHPANLHRFAARK